MFTHMDAIRSEPSLLETEYIDLADYPWVLASGGMSILQVGLEMSFVSVPVEVDRVVHEATIGVDEIAFYLNAAKVPYKYIPAALGSSGPCLDRKAWLRLQVFEAQAIPQVAFEVRSPFSFYLIEH